MERVNMQQSHALAPLFAAAMFANPASAATQPVCTDGAAAFTGAASANSCAPWIDRQIAQLQALQSEWSKFDADPLQLKTISQLRALLSNSRRSDGVVGHLVPGADGSLQAEWHLKSATVGLLVEDDGTYSSWVRFHDSEQHVEEYGPSALSFFQTLVNQYRLNV
jgi:hypothetical protein